MPVIKYNCVKCFELMTEIDVSTKDGPQRSVLYCENCNETSDCGYVEKVGDKFFIYNGAKFEQQQNDEIIKEEKKENAEPLKTNPDYLDALRYGLMKFRPLHYAELVDERDKLKAHIEYLNKENDKVARENIALNNECELLRDISRVVQREIEKVKQERDEYKTALGRKDYLYDELSRSYVLACEGRNKLQGRIKTLENTNEILCNMFDRINAIFSDVAREIIEGKGGDKV